MENKGLAAVWVVVLTALISLAVGAVGYWWYSTQVIAEPARTTTTTPTTTSSTTPTTTPSQPEVNYLTVKEWGIKVPELPEGNVISYQISAYDKNYADFVSSGQKTLGGSCGEFSFARYHIFQAENGYKSSDDVFQNKLNNAAKNNLAIKAGGKTYYILGDMTGGDCTGTLKVGQSLSQQEVTANNNLLTSLKGLVASK